MPLAMLIAIIGIVLSVVALYKNQSRGFSIAGMITSIVGAVLAILTVILVIITFSRLDAYDTFDSDEDYFSPYPYAEEGEADEDPLDKFEQFFEDYMQ